VPNRRRWLLLVLGLAGLAVLAAAMVASMTSREDRITRQSYNGIRAGMTEHEVEKLLGGPAGDYTNGWYAPPMIIGGCGLCDDELYRNVDVRVQLEWTGSKGEVWIGFDERGRVMQKYFWPVVRVDRSHEPLIVTLRRWLRF
jgi:hypothetical protein